jgi:5'-nucleotidase
VVVVAPDRDWSGSGAAIGELDIDRPLPVNRVEIPGAADVEAWSLAGPPAATVIAGMLGGFGDPPELVVSGINAGLNTGRTVLHSGTVGAALTAQNFGISGLAVSVAVGERWHWDTAAALAVEVLDLVTAAPPRSVLNLNVPACPRAEVRGVRWTRVAAYGAVRARVRQRGDAALELELEPTGYDPPADTDQGAVDRGFAAITTLAGIVEAWPRAHERSGLEIRSHFGPGAELEPVHSVPDSSDHRLLRARLHEPEPPSPPTTGG